MRRKRCRRPHELRPIADVGEHFGGDDERPPRDRGEIEFGNEISGGNRRMIALPAARPPRRPRTCSAEMPISRIADRRVSP